MFVMQALKASHCRFGVEMPVVGQRLLLSARLNIEVDHMDSDQFVSIWHHKLSSLSIRLLDKK